MVLSRSELKVSPTVPTTDIVVPLSLWDESPTLRGNLMRLCLRFDENLDPERLRHGLQTLTELGGWRKLGARLRKTSTGKLEYHIPVAFSPERPGFAFSVDKYETTIQDHPVASRIPRSTRYLASYNVLEGLENLTHRSGAPTCVDDYLFSDEPQLAVHIVSFKGATLVSLSVPHTFTDGLGLYLIAHAWTLVLNGRESNVPPVCNFDKDPLADLGTAPTEQSVLAPYFLDDFSKTQFIFRHISESARHQESSRLLFIPTKHITALKKAALQDLPGIQKSEQEQGLKPVPLISDGDILVAYLTRLAIKNEGANSSRQISILNAFSTRAALSSSLLPTSKGVCLSNVLIGVQAFGTASDILTKPLAYTASLIRRSLVEQATPAQIEAFAALARQSLAETRIDPIFGSVSTRMVVFANSTKSGYFKLDFGGAAVKGEGHTEQVVHARPSFVLSAGRSQPSGFVICGIDAGGYWIQGKLRSDLWPGVEKDLKELATPCNSQATRSTFGEGLGQGSSFFAKSRL